jgi:hypothetical protein
MDSSVSPKDETSFLLVCHHISNAVYRPSISCPAVAWSPFSSPRGVTVTLLITGKDRQPPCIGQELRHSEIHIHQSAASFAIYKLKPSSGSASTKDRDTQRFSIRLCSRMALQVFSHCKLFRHSSTVRSALISLRRVEYATTRVSIVKYSLMRYWLDKVSALRTVTGITE